MAQNGSPAELYSVPFFINGTEVHPPKSFDITSPATGKVVHRSGSASDTEVEAAVDSAAQAFKTWKKALPKERRDILLKAAEILQRRNDELGQFMIDETGCPKKWADFNLGVTRDLVLDVAGRLSSLNGIIPTAADPDVGAMILREPFGVILAIAPWFVLSPQPR